MIDREEDRGLFDKDGEATWVESESPREAEVKVKGAVCAPREGAVGVRWGVGRIGGRPRAAGVRSRAVEGAQGRPCEGRGSLLGSRV